MMANFYMKRLSRHMKRMMKYMRYVLNDHFVLVMLFLVGGLSFYYSQFLETLPQGLKLISLITGVFWLILLHFGNVATLAKEADQVFLLPKEKQLKGYFSRSLIYSCVFPFVVIFFLGGLTMPLLLVGTGQPLLDFIWFLPMLWLLKGGHLLIQYYRLFQHEHQTNRHARIIWTAFSLLSIFLGIFAEPWLGLILAVVQFAFLYWLYWIKNDEALNWERMIDLEEERMHRIYQFINLFTDVPEVSGKVKRRKYLDPILHKIRLKQSNTYLYLYARRMLRGSEFSGLYLRLVIIAGVLLYFLQDFYFSLGISVLFIYLIGFQMIPLYGQFKYMVLTHLYPVSKKQKLAALQKLLRWLLIVASILFGAIAFFALSMSVSSLLILAALLVETFAFIQVYLPYRIKKMEN